MFSSRIPSNLSPNRLAEAVAARRRSGDPIVDLTESNPTRAGFDYPPDLLAPLADPRGLVYTPQAFGLREAREAVAADYARRGLPVGADRIALTASTSEAYSLLFKLLADPGDEVLVPRPSYPLFDHLTRLDAVVSRPYDLDYHGAWSIDLASVEAAFTPRTKAVLAVSPNNPTGSFLTREELDRLVEQCAARRVAIIADEVFADYELEAGASRSAGHVASQTGALAFSLGGLSKSAGLPQAKLGWMAVSGPRELVDSAIARLEIVCDTYLSVATPVQAAAAELLRDGAAIRGQIQARISANYRRLTEIAAGVPACRRLRAEGGWYAVLQVPSLQPEEDLVVDLVERDGIVTHPGYFFDFPRESYLVVSLLPREEQFAAAVARLVRHFDCTVDAP
jgi:alanine-synthesizing transaminase